MSSLVELSLVVSTVGRVPELERLLESLEIADGDPSFEVVVVDQSADGRCVALARSRSWSYPIRTTTSPRGASIGRNAGLQLATGAIVGFPDDDAFLPPSTLAATLAAMRREPDLAGVSGQQQTRDGRPSMLRWRKRPQDVTRTNFLHTSIMSTLFVARSWLEQVDGFDEEMGVGAPGWYHAGEESDLLLRVLDAGGRIAYDPAIVVWQDEPRDQPDDAFVRKMLEYGCGQGHLWRKQRLPLALLAWYLSRKVAGAVVRSASGRRTLARADLAWLRGSLAGLRDVCPPEMRDLGTYHRDPARTRW